MSAKVYTSQAQKQAAYRERKAEKEILQKERSIIIKFLIIFVFFGFFLFFGQK
jgi:hypothetical protein